MSRSRGPARLSFTRTQQLAVFVAGVSVAAGFGGWLWAYRNLQVRLDDLAASYVSAVADRRGDEAFDLLCPRSRARTSPEQLSTLGDSLGGLVFLSAGSRASSPDGLWPWTDEGSGGVLVDVGGTEQTRFLSMSKTGSGWRVCPPGGEGLLGYELR